MAMQRTHSVCFWFLVLLEVRVLCLKRLGARAAVEVERERVRLDTLVESRLRAGERGENRLGHPLVLLVVRDLRLERVRLACHRKVTALVAAGLAEQHVDDAGLPLFSSR